MRRSWRRDLFASLGLLLVGLALWTAATTEGNGPGQFDLGHLIGGALIVLGVAGGLTLPGERVFWADERRRWPNTTFLAALTMGVVGGSGAFGPALSAHFMIWGGVALAGAAVVLGKRVAEERVLAQREERVALLRREGFF